MSIELRPDNTLRARIPELTRKDTGAALTDGDVDTVKAEILDKGDGSVLESVSMTHQGAGEWEGLLGADHSLEEGDRVDVRFAADGGNLLKSTWVRRDVRVDERPIP